MLDTRTILLIGVGCKSLEQNLGKKFRAEIESPARVVSARRAEE